MACRTRYEPYGQVAAGSTQTIGFTGHVNDIESGLTYMQQRYYDPVAGRFLSIDPVTTDANTGGSFNRYAYAVNNPYKYFDPDGRHVEIVGTAEEKTEIAKVLEKARKTDAGNEAYLIAHKSEFNFIIQATGGGSVASPTTTNALLNADGAAGSGSGGSLYFNSKDRPVAITSQGDKPTDPSVVMVHELGHLADYARGTLDQSLSPNSTSAAPYRSSEDRAMIFENRARAQIQAKQIAAGGPPDPSFSPRIQYRK